MENTTIYLKLEKGELEYRDSEKHQGKTIETHVKNGTKVVWKLDKCSGIDDIVAIHIEGDTSVLDGKPVKIDFDHWEATAANKAEGEISYKVEVKRCKKCSEDVEETAEITKIRPPRIFVP